MNEITLQKLFRVLVVLSALLYTFLWFTPFISHLWQSPDEITLLVLAGYGAYVPFLPGLHWTILLVWIAIFIGLIRFNRIARGAFFVIIVIELIDISLRGYWILSPSNAVILSIINMLNGAILVMAYFTPLARMFTKKKEVLTTSEDK